MTIENYRWIAAIVASHPEQKVIGRTRLQKEVKLLQRLGFPTDYGYTIHFYGPYSDALQSDICLLEAFGLVDETAETTRDGKPYYILRARPVTASLPDVGAFHNTIRVMNDASAVVLELAATYDAFRESGDDHRCATERLRRKKGSKCSAGNEELALKLLEKLQLPCS